MLSAPSQSTQARRPDRLLRLERNEGRPLERCSGLLVQRYSAATLAVELGADFKLMAEEQESHVTPGSAVQLFQYCWFRRAT